MVLKRVRGIRYQHVLFHVALLAVWAVFAGNLRVETILSGMVVTAIPVVLFRHTYRIIATSRLFVSAHRLSKFLVVVLVSMVTASIRVAALALRPGIQVRSSIIQYEPQIQDRLAVVMLACAITVTPGTIVVDRDDRFLYVHILVRLETNDEEIREGVERLERPLRVALRENTAP